MDETVIEADCEEMEMEGDQVVDESAQGTCSSCVKYKEELELLKRKIT